MPRRGAREHTRIVIIGAGPAGLGAAWRLHEIGHTGWDLFERDRHVGGLAASYVDDAGFTWDIGGHVVFSHYPYFDDLLDSLLERQWVSHDREAWVWMRDCFIPYPLQNNIHHLPTAELVECVEGLLDAADRGRTAAHPRHEGPGHDPGPTFADWILQSFGPGLARVFMVPYNGKVWATDPAEMSASWVGERVATVDLKRILRNILMRQDDLGWGPNATFRFPLHGGTGRIWQAIAERLPADHLHLATEAVTIDVQNKTVHLGDRTTADYDWLITTIPIDHLVNRMGSQTPRPDLQSPARRLRYSSTHVVGVGLAGPTPERLATKCWMYFPEPELPFYRVTLFSNYSPHNVPHPGQQWSLMAEISESAARPVNGDTVVQQAIDGLRRARLIESDRVIESVWHRRVEHGYPTPSLQRDSLLDEIDPALESMNILSRGRFGAWKYEVGNMDHSFMQGVEAVNRLFFGDAEVTLRSPTTVNDRRPSGRRPD